MITMASNQPLVAYGDYLGHDLQMPRTAAGLPDPPSRQHRTFAALLQRDGLKAPP